MTGPLPVVDVAKCVGDAACVVVCPTGCLELVASRPWLARPRDCARCGACVAVCPVGAVALEPPAAAGYHAGEERTG